MTSTPRVGVSMTPNEFNLVMEALRFYHSNETHFAADSDTDIRQRNEHRAKAVQLKALIETLDK